ncbi:MAG: shikimate kinase [Lachnospiraceae bacterium]
MNNIILIGMPAVGKSTIGVVVAKRLGFEFVDTDLLIQKQEECLLKEIIKQRGIEGFLAVENQVNRDLDMEHAVIAPGGSVVYCSEAMEHYKKIGMVVYLKAPFEIIEKRITDMQDRGVVLQDGQTLRMLYDEREKLFEKYEDVTIEEESSLEKTIEKVLEIMNKEVLKNDLINQ